MPLYKSKGRADDQGIPKKIKILIGNQTRLIEEKSDEIVKLLAKIETLDKVVERQTGKMDKKHSDLELQKEKYDRLSKLSYHKSEELNKLRSQVDFLEKKTGSLSPIPIVSWWNDGKICGGETSENATFEINEKGQLTIFFKSCRKLVAFVENEEVKKDLENRMKRYRGNVSEGLIGMGPFWIKKFSTDSLKRGIVRHLFAKRRLLYIRFG